MTDKTAPSIPGYRILRVIGQGGMSTVYLAEQESLGRKVALKVMLAEALADEVSRARFENEARIIARLEHPNIVSIFEVGRTADGQPFYSMPHLPHGHLAQRRLAGDQPRIAAILRSLLQALDYAHVRGVVHRDVKAENVLFDDTDRPLLADFGIAQRRGSNPRLTHAGLAVGSTAYMPPEQARGLDVDRRADLYSIGVLAFEMLTGQLPYNAGDALSMAMRHVQDPIPRLPPALKRWQGFIDKAMAKRREDRHASAQEMLEALEALEQRAGKAFAPVEAAAAAPLPVDERPAPRRRAWALGLAALAAVGAGTAYYLAQREAAAPATSGVASSTAPALPAPQAEPGLGALPALPQENDVQELGLSAYLANARQQLQDGQLLAPANANAWDSLEAAWRVNPLHPETQRLTALLFDGLGISAERALREGDTAQAMTAFQRARQLDARRGGTGVAIEQLRARLDNALDARLAALLAKPDAPAAAALLAQTAWLGLPAPRQRELQERLAGAAGKAPARTVAAAEAAPPPPKPLEYVTASRADYARFANASGRAAADCGKGLFGRKRSWSNTGSDRKPVACVSAADALAYAAWLGAQDGHRYRLPSAGELRAQPATPVSGWLTLCADRACGMRMASGKPQALDATRGYDDIGIRLVRTD